MIEWKQMTMQEAENKMEVLREIFDVVRLLKGSDLQAAGMERKLAGRENDKQRIIYSVGGMPVEDIAWGETVYKRALELGIGVKLHLWDEPELH